MVYEPLLVRRQYGSQQFIPMTSNLASVDLEYQGEHYEKLLQIAILHWRERYESRLYANTDKTILGYDTWRSAWGCNIIILGLDGSIP